MIVSYLCLCLFLGMIVYMGYFQIFKSKELLESPYNKRQDVKEKQVIRGKILASDGTALAETQIDEDGNESRVYPFGSLFAQVVGYSDYGTSGLESSQNYYLLQSHADLSEKVQNDLKNRKNTGDNVVTTLDVNLQSAARNMLGEHSGAVVVLDAKTGAVLADVSTPDFDANSVSENWDVLTSDESNSPFLNRATQGLYPPGSTFKIVTALTYYRKYGSFDNFTFNCEGSYTQNDYTIHCIGDSVHGPETFGDAFANSCNCAFAYMIAECLDSEDLAKTVKDLKLTEDLSLPVPSTSGLFNLKKDDGVQLAMQTAIGQGNTLLNPMEMAMLTQAIANDGEMIEPSYILRTESYSGTIVKENQMRSMGQILERKEASALKDLMKQVVSSGTGYSLSDLPFATGGKTGTAQYGPIEEDRAHSWFTGFTDTGKNDIVVTVLIEGGGNGIAPAIDAARGIFETWAAAQ